MEWSWLQLTEEEKTGEKSPPKGSEIKGERISVERG